MYTLRGPASDDAGPNRMQRGVTMRSVRKVRGATAIVLTIPLAVMLAVAPAAGASTSERSPVGVSSHCGGYILTQGDYATGTATSRWIINPSLAFPPVCQQYAFAICSDFVAYEGNPTVNPGEVSTARCPPGTTFLFAGSGVEHVPSVPS
jgi:hypothetical protein